MCFSNQKVTCWGVNQLVAEDGLMVVGPALPAAAVIGLLLSCGWKNDEVEAGGPTTGQIRAVLFC